jgi:hypothetical protein
VDEDGRAWYPSLIYTAQLRRVSLAIPTSLDNIPVDLNSITCIVKSPGLV